MTRQRTIVVAGALANKPWNGGEAWVRLSWVLGLRRLGYRVVFIEQIDLECCVDARGNRAPFADSTNLAFFRHVISAFGLEGSAALICGDGETFEGLSAEELTPKADEAQLLVNISGHLCWPPLFDRFACKAYVDIDPGFTQFWHEQGVAGTRLEAHDLHFTIAENIGGDDCLIPTCGLNWLTVRQPVVLEDWDATERSSRTRPRFTTVAAWRGSFGPITSNGRTFGLKVHEFRKVLALPRRVPDADFEIALAIHTGDARDLASLREHDWRIVDPADVARDPQGFRQYVRASDAEFSVAQGIYVDTRSGWVSDRTVRYLASGRPAVVQDTGLGSHYPDERGLLTFSDLDGAAEACDRVGRDYARHARAARELAERCFDSDRVLPDFVKRCGLSRASVIA